MTNSTMKPSKAVICIETNEIFNSIAQAQRKYPGGSIRNAINHQWKSSGLTWKYYDLENKCIIETERDTSHLHPMTEQKKLERNKKISETSKGKYIGANSTRGKKVIRIDTLEVFDTARIASLKFSNNKNAVTAAIAGNYKFNNARWQYYDDYLNGVQLTKQKSRSRFTDHTHSEESKKKTSETLKSINKESVNKVKIQNVDTGEIFDSMRYISKDSRFNCKYISSAFYRAGGLQCRCGGYNWKKLI